MTRREPLSARLADHAERLQRLAHDVAGREPSLASCLILHAAEAAILSLAAEDLERGRTPRPGLRPMGHPLAQALAAPLRATANAPIGVPA